MYFQILVVLFISVWYVLFVSVPLSVYHRHLCYAKLLMRLLKNILTSIILLENSVHCHLYVMM